MRKILTILFVSLSMIGYSQVSKIKSIAPTRWTIQVPETHTETTNNKLVGTAVGSAAGYYLIGGPLGLLAGAIVGHSVTSNPQSTTTITYTKKELSGYIITLSNGESYRTTTLYHIGQSIDTKTIKQE